MLARYDVKVNRSTSYDRSNSASLLRKNLPLSSASSVKYKIEKGNGLVTGAHRTVGIFFPVIASTARAICPPLLWPHRPTREESARENVRIELRRSSTVVYVRNRSSKILEDCVAEPP